MVVLFLGIHVKSLSSKSILIGVYVGTIISLGFMVGNWLGMPVPVKPLGIHAGLWGLICNLLIVFGLNRKKD